MKSFILKTILHILIINFGIESINDKLAEIYYEESERTKNTLFDKISEAYDKITEMFKYGAIDSKKP